MAAALNLPELCTSLVSQGVAVNSRWDNIRPVDLAFATAATFAEDLDRDIGVEAWDLPVLLPVNRRRNLTINSLIQQEARPSKVLFSQDRRFSPNMTAFLASGLGDVTPIKYLLSSGVVPDERELPIFSTHFHLLDCTNAEAKSSMLSLLRYLASESVRTEKWAKELGSEVSRWCIKAKVSFSEHDHIFDTQLLTVRDILPARMIRAIIDDNLELVKRYLAIGEIDVVECRHDGETLLHLAARNDACDVFELLITAGCDPYCEDVNGSLPIHAHHCESGIRFYETLMRLNITLSNPDARGMTIWHSLAQTRTLDENLFYELIRLDREGTCRALRTRTLAGETLLSIVLRPRPLGILGVNSRDLLDVGLDEKEYGESQPGEFATTSSSSVSSEDSLFTISSRHRRDMKREKDKRERVFFSLLDICSELPNFWSNHGPVMGTAACFGSGKVMRRLVEMGAEFEPAVEGTRTPLHELSSLMPLQEAQLLLDAYHYSVEYKFRGRLPVEMYIRNALRGRLDPNAQVIKMLTTPSVLRNGDAEGLTLWEIFLPMEIWISSDTDEKALTALTNLIDKVTMTMVGLGAMQVYEERNKVCGIIVVFEMIRLCGHTCDVSKAQPSFITVDTVREMLRQTQHWASVRNSYTVQQFLKMAMQSGDLEMVRILLDHEVDIHFRIKGASALEEACCRSYVGKAKVEKSMLQLLVDYCKSDKLNDTSPEDGLGLLHRLALRVDTTDNVWLMESLIQRGANVNILARNKKSMSVLAFHLEKKSLPCVELLLRRGADPCHGRLTALSIALESDNAEFLWQVLSHSAQRSSVINWGKSMDIYVEAWGQGRTNLKNANALHLASAKGSLACLEFLLERKLIKAEDSMTKEGWTPLHVSAYMGRTKPTKLLISKGFDPMAENELGQTPLHLAVYRDGISVVEVLRKHGASESLDDFGKSPKDYAQERNLVELVNYFEAWRDEVGNWGHLSRKQPSRLAAALGRAIGAGDQKYCQNLISKGYPIDAILPRTGGCTPLMLALERGELEIAEWFLNEGASTLKSFEDSDWGTMTIIEAAASDSNLAPILSAIVDSYHKCGGDLVCGLDYPLHYAVKSGNTEGIEIILQAWEKFEQDAQV
jgi:ankyrin repeat protein